MPRTCNIDGRGKTFSDNKSLTNHCHKSHGESPSTTSHQPDPAKFVCSWEGCSYFSLNSRGLQGHVTFAHSHNHKRYPSKIEESPEIAVEKQKTNPCVVRTRSSSGRKSFLSGDMLAAKTDRRVNESDRNVMEDVAWTADDVSSAIEKAVSPGDTLLHTFKRSAEGLTDSEGEFFVRGVAIKKQRKVLQMTVAKDDVRLSKSSESDDHLTATEFTPVKRSSPLEYYFVTASNEVDETSSTPVESMISDESVVTKVTAKLLGDQLQVSSSSAFTKPQQLIQPPQRDDLVLTEQSSSSPENEYRTSSSSHLNHGKVIPLPSAVLKMGSITRFAEPPETLNETDFLSVPKHVATTVLLNPALCPSVVTLFMGSREDVECQALQECLAKEACVLLRNFSEALGINLAMFSTKCIVETAPNETIDTPSQKRQASSVNYDDQNAQLNWSFISTQGTMTLAKYGAYQAQEFQEHSHDVLKRQFRANPGASRSSALSKPKSDVRFATNIDLHDQAVWGRQLAELAKVPVFFQLRTTSNMLNYLDHTVLGVNSVQMYMKVPGCRTPGHQENLNFCSINLNVGPGNCEWFCVTFEYWRQIHDLCEKNDVPFLNGSWWPNLDDLTRAKIPVFRFVQHAGELVWINSGTVHWVHASGFCNNISWNVGACTANQYNMAMERFEWNKIYKFKSLVPMLHLTWNMAAKMTFELPKDDSLLRAVRGVMYGNVTYCDNLFHQLTTARVVLLHVKTEEPNYCIDCEEEIFNIDFFEEPAGKRSTNNVVRCFECSRRVNVDFRVFKVCYKYSMKELIQIYNSCQMKGRIPAPEEAKT